MVAPVIQTRFSQPPTGGVGQIGAGFARGIIGLQTQQAQRQQQVLEQQRQQEIGGLLREAVAQPTEAQRQLAEQTALLGFDPAIAEAGPTEADVIQQIREATPLQAEQLLTAVGLDTASKRAEASLFANQVQAAPLETQNRLIRERAEKIAARGGNPTDTLELLDMNQQDRTNVLIGIQLADLKTKERFTVRERVTRRAEIPAELRAFEELTKELDPKQKKTAAMIKLGLEPRAVGSAIQTISEKGIEEEVGKASAIIKQREKFGEMTGASRAKAIDKGFEQVVRINQGIDTIDRAISALEGGAKTGAIQRFLPSMRAASVELENIRNQFALDVIGGVTLGAISESELDLAKQVGLPEGLDEPQLIEHLRQRRAAQEKLRNYYQEQINHLDQDGTVASFLRQKEREQAAAPLAQPTAQPAETPKQVIRFDAQGNMIP